MAVYLFSPGWTVAGDFNRITNIFRSGSQFTLSAGEREGMRASVHHTDFSYG
jgi:hypothetical protein